MKLRKKGLDAAPKEKSLLTVLEMTLEMCERGYSFQKVDLYRYMQQTLLLMETH